MFSRQLSRAVCRAPGTLKYSSDPTNSNVQETDEKNAVIKKNSTSDLATKIAQAKETELKEFRWPSPWAHREPKTFGMLSSFNTGESKTELIKALTTKWDLSPSGIKKWWAQKKEKEAIFLQQYIPQRNQILGNELAAAHFIVFRGGKVKFFGEHDWVQANKNREFNLPKFFDPSKILQAIDCSGAEFYYEGFDNFRNLNGLEWFSVNGSDEMDDWCMDVLSNIFSHSLLYLDIRNCPNITERGIGCLYKLKRLRTLLVDDIFMNNELEMTCLLLQDMNPELDIRME